MTENFDFASWKSEGESALNSLRAQEKALNEKLSEVRAQIKDVTTMLGKNNGSKRRYRIGPRILKTLEGGGSIELTGLFVSLSSDFKGLTRETFLDAVSRLGKRPDVTLTDTHIMLVPVE